MKNDVSLCLRSFAEQIGGVVQRAEGVAKSLRSSEIRLLFLPFSPQSGESGNPSVPLGHLPYNSAMLRDRGGHSFA